MDWKRDEAIADVLEACDGAFGRVSLWWERPVPIKRCEARMCTKRFPVGGNRKYCGKKCADREAARRQRRNKRRLKYERQKNEASDRR